jgi:hypothetical protein
MSSPIIEPGFSADILTFLRLLAKTRVRYLIVGGEAVIYHGYPRLTGEIDFFYDNILLNCRRLFDALLEFWDDRIPGLNSSEELRAEKLILQFGRPPHRIDLMNRIDGVTFPRAWASRVRVQLKTRPGLVPVHYIGLRPLLANKKATGRPKDLDDALSLRPKLRGQRRRLGLDSLAPARSPFGPGPRRSAPAGSEL